MLEIDSCKAFDSGTGADSAFEYLLRKLTSPHKIEKATLSKAALSTARVTSSPAYSCRVISRRLNLSLSKTTTFSAHVANRIDVRLLDFNVDLRIRQNIGSSQAHLQLICPHKTDIAVSINKFLYHIAMSKEGYEKVPDVETPASPTAESYADLAGDQAKLMQNMDAALGMANLDFSMPAVDPAELASKGGDSVVAMVKSMLLPTITAVCTVVGGMLLNYQAQYSSWAETVVQFFPYINALIVFYSSITPLSNRLKDAVKPVFDKSDKIQDDVTEKVGDITVKVDTTIDAIQEEVGDVLKPLKPTIDKAASKAAPLKQIAPDIEIPDTSDIDEEFDELQGKVGGKVKEAQGHLSLEKYIPGPLKSLDNFYWQVIFPVLILALVLQLALAWISASQAMHTSPPTQLELQPVPTRYLRGYATVPSVTPVHKYLRRRLQAQDAAASAQDAAKDAANSAVSEASSQVDQAKDAMNNQTAVVKQQAQDTIDQAKEEADNQIANAKEQVQAAKNEAGARVDELKGQASDQIAAAQEQANAAKDEAVQKFNKAKEDATAQVDAAKKEAQEKLDAAKAQANAQISDLQDQMKSKQAEIEEEYDQYKSQAKGIIISVVSSYLMSLLQMGLLFLFTSPKVKAFIINMFMKKVNDEANRTLREFGVTTAVEDVMGTRMSRIRKKLLKLFRTVGKIQDLMDKIPDIPGLGNAQDKVNDMLGRVGKKQGSLLGKLFK